jgi:hypothetical protein
MNRAVNLVVKGLIISTLSLFAIQSATAHEVTSLTGANAVNLGIASHKHYRSPGKYGDTYRTGHGVEAGNSGIIIWSAKSYNGYGSSQTRNKHYRGGFNHRSNYGKNYKRSYGSEKR